MRGWARAYPNWTALPAPIVVARVSVCWSYGMQPRHRCGGVPCRSARRAPPLQWRGLCHERHFASLRALLPTHKPASAGVALLLLSSSAPQPLCSSSTVTAARPTSGLTATATAAETGSSVAAQAFCQLRRTRYLSWHLGAAGTGSTVRAKPVLQLLRTRHSSLQREVRSPVAERRSIWPLTLDTLLRS